MAEGNEKGEIGKKKDLFVEIYYIHHFHFVCVWRCMKESSNKSN